ncbi:MAG: M56 family metallopeptidase [Lachnoclostridium sp.]|jgi:beta-lactamase regulating signal transducer with metallopeptidase domain|nr:M56 family metallopeptidase [Lachnoclostridium sp.]
MTEKRGDDEMDMTGMINFIDVILVYFMLQLLPCAIISLFLIGVIMLLRKTIFRKYVFIRGMLWTVLLLVPFLGKLRLFYENRAVLNVFRWLMLVVMDYPWLNRIYMLIALFSIIYVLFRRHQLSRIVRKMKSDIIGGRKIYITDMDVTPFTTGLFVPKIIIPEIMRNDYNDSEIEIVLQHERRHIELGHLWFGFIWDLFRCLLWVNPLFMICRKYFSSDMEDICDRVCIQNDSSTGYEYGIFLLRSTKLLQASNRKTLSVVAYAGEEHYSDIKRRMKNIADFKPYHKHIWRCLICLFVAVFLLTLFGVKQISYARYSNVESITVFNENATNILLPDSEQLHKAITYDDDYVYIDSERMNQLLKDHNIEGQKMFIYFGGYSKLPGVGGSGEGYIWWELGASEKIPYESNRNFFYELIRVL